MAEKHEEENGKKMRGDVIWNYDNFKTHDILMCIIFPLMLHQMVISNKEPPASFELGSRIGKMSTPNLLMILYLNRDQMLLGKCDGLKFVDPDYGKEFIVPQDQESFEKEKVKN